MREIALRWVKYGWRDCDLERFENLHSPGFIDRDSSSRSSDIKGFISGIRTLYEAFPDFRADVQDLVIDTMRGSVAIRWTATGTHHGTYLDIAPSGKTIRFKGIEVVSIKDDRIVERWGEWDGLNLLEQLRE
jgi:steroid delta-isomerase-like uncharacterized protein